MLLSVLRIRLLNVSLTTLKIFLQRSNKLLNQQLLQLHQFPEICQILEEAQMKMIRTILKIWQEEREIIIKPMRTALILKQVCATIIKTQETPLKCHLFLRERQNHKRIHQESWLWARCKREAYLQSQHSCVFVAYPHFWVLWTSKESVSLWQCLVLDLHLLCRVQEIYLTYLPKGRIWCKMLSNYRYSRINRLQSLGQQESK